MWLCPGVPQPDKDVRSHGAHDRGKTADASTMVPLSWQVGRHRGGDAKRQGGRRGGDGGRLVSVVGLPVHHTFLTPTRRRGDHEGEEQQRMKVVVGGGTCSRLSSQ